MKVNKSSIEKEATVNVGNSYNPKKLYVTIRWRKYFGRAEADGDGFLVLKRVINSALADLFQRIEEELTKLTEVIDAGD